MQLDREKTVPIPPRPLGTKRIRVIQEEEVVEEETIYQVVEQQPEFPGGVKALMKYLRNNTKQNGSKDKTFVNFVVNVDGSIKDVTVLRSSGDAELDKEAVRVVESMPKWKPGKQQGKAVRVRFTLPVTFKLLGSNELQPTKAKKSNIKELQDELQRKDVVIKDK